MTLHFHQQSATHHDVQRKAALAIAAVVQRRRSRRVKHAQRQPVLELPHLQRSSQVESRHGASRVREREHLLTAAQGGQILSDEHA